MHCKTLTLLAASLLLALSCPARAEVLPEDSSTATVYAYFGVGSDSLSLESFRGQLAEMTSSSYNIIALPDLLLAQQTGRALPRRTIALTFDRIDDAFITTVAPLLEARKIPYTLFVSAGQIDQKQGAATWENLRRLRDTPGVTLGMTAFNYGHLAALSRDRLAADLNQARSRLREELDIEPQYFAYPYGEYSPAYRSLIEQQGFAAAFGQQSGVTYRDSDPLTLPRFTITEEFSDIDRLRMTSDALPFPVSDIAPASFVLDRELPYPGFTVSRSITAAELKSLTCFASGAGQMRINLLGNNRVELRFPEHLTDGFASWRGRINCTLPVRNADDSGETRWRWLGFLYAVPE